MNTGYANVKMHRNTPNYDAMHVIMIEECCARIRYLGLGQVITSHIICVKYFLALTLDACSRHNIHELVAIIQHNTLNYGVINDIIIGLIYMKQIMNEVCCSLIWNQIIVPYGLSFISFALAW